MTKNEKAYSARASSILEITRNKRKQNYVKLINVKQKVNQK